MNLNGAAHFDHFTPILTNLLEKILLCGGCMGIYKVILQDFGIESMLWASLVSVGQHRENCLFVMNDNKNMYCILKNKFKASKT